MENNNKSEYLVNEKEGHITKKDEEVGEVFYESV